MKEELLNYHLLNNYSKRVYLDYIKENCPEEKIAFLARSEFKDFIKQSLAIIQEEPSIIISEYCPDDEIFTYCEKVHKIVTNNGILILNDQECNNSILTNYEINETIVKIVEEKLDYSIKDINTIHESEDINCSFLIWDNTKEKINYNLIKRVSLNCKIIIIGREFNENINFLLSLFRITHFPEYTSLRELIKIIIRKEKRNLKNANSSKLLNVDLSGTFTNSFPEINSLKKLVDCKLYHKIDSLIMSNVFSLLDVKTERISADNLIDSYEIIRTLSSGSMLKQYLSERKSRRATINRFILSFIYFKDICNHELFINYDNQILDSLLHDIKINKSCLDLLQDLKDASKNIKNLKRNELDLIFITSNFPSFYSENNSGIENDYSFTCIDEYYKIIISGNADSVYLNNQILSCIYFRYFNELIQLTDDQLISLPRFLVTLLFIHNSDHTFLRNFFFNLLKDSSPSPRKQIMKYIYFEQKRQLDKNSFEFSSEDILINFLELHMQNFSILESPFEISVTIFFLKHTNSTFHLNLLNDFLDRHHYDKNGVKHLLKLLEKLIPFSTTELSL
jgi:hypothetical protein